MSVFVRSYDAVCLCLCCVICMHGDGCLFALYAEIQNIGLHRQCLICIVPSHNPYRAGRSSWESKNSQAIKDIRKGYIVLKGAPSFNPTEYGWVLEKALAPWDALQLPSQVRACMFWWAMLSCYIWSACCLYFSN